MHIYCPSQLDDLAAVRFINDFWRSKTENELVLDFSTLSFVYPSGVLVSALGIRDLIRQRSSLSLVNHVSGHTANYGAVSYLS